ncbi:phosphatidate cytidylyltransferase [Candidatus Pelagibacter communis]|uniref:phosphatidate cytidylyltransferase n=1 Tax=Pelagibacter ubique TaxID=198252 RepID=UPI00092CFDF1|nr:phosphatidate cytidylyltransferase [Candidatus Pelagibacter ubique]
MSQELTKRILSSLVLIPITLFFIIKGSYLFIFFLMICLSLITYEWYMMSKKKPYSVFGYIFLFFSFYTIYKLRIDNDYWFLLFVTILCVSTDIGGYVFGKIFKGPKLTKFSPNKTYAGMMGGYLLSIISSIILINFYSSEELIIKWLIFTILISTISQLGDIIISYFKRLSKIKDTGKIIPGHGGLLDRVDGMIFAFPISYLIILIDFL